MHFKILCQSIATGCPFADIASFPYSAGDREPGIGSKCILLLTELKEGLLFDYIIVPNQVGMMMDREKLRNTQKARK